MHFFFLGKQQQLQLGQRRMATDPRSSDPILDEVVLRSDQQWLRETDDPVQRQFLLGPQLVPYQDLLSTLLAPCPHVVHSTSSNPTSAPDITQFTTLTQRTRSAQSHWITQVLSALHVPPSLYSRGAEEYLSSIYRMARFDAQVAYYHDASLTVLDRALALVSTTGSTNPALEFAQQGPMQATLVAVACMQREGSTSSVLPPALVPWGFLPPGTTSAAEGEDREQRTKPAAPVPLPEPLATLVRRFTTATTTKRKTRAGGGTRNTVRSSLAQLSEWKKQCTFVPHLWLEGTPSSSWSLLASAPTLYDGQLAPSQHQAPTQRGAVRGVASPACVAVGSGELPTGKQGKGDKEEEDEEEDGSEFEDGRAHHREHEVAQAAQQAAATFAYRLVEQSLWRSEILHRCGGLHLEIIR